MDKKLALANSKKYFSVLHDEMDSFLKNFFSNNYDLMSFEQFKFRPALEVNESKDGYKVRVQLPGVSKEDIHVEVHKDYLTLSAEMKEEKEETNDKNNIKTSEFKYGKIYRNIAFDCPINKDNVEAKFKNGVLVIDAKKEVIDSSEPKKLEIKD